MTFLRALFVLIALATLPAAAHAKCDEERNSNRIALVIGNGTYLPGQWSKLTNAPADADVVCEGFAEQGFRVFVVRDASRATLAAAVAQFAALTPKADVALIYYAGHGFEYGGINWLVPVDAPVATSRAKLRNQFFDLATIVQAVQQAKRGLVFLDACRTRSPIVQIADLNNADPEDRAGEINLPGEFEGVVVYSTARGTKAFDAAPVTSRNSPFAESVVERLSLPDVELMDFLRFVRLDVKRRTANLQDGPQVPTAAGFLSSRLYFNQPPLAPGMAPAKDPMMDMMGASGEDPTKVIYQPVATPDAGEISRDNGEVDNDRGTGGIGGSFKVMTMPSAGSSGTTRGGPAGSKPAIQGLTQRMAALDPGRARSALDAIDQEARAKEDEPQLIGRVLENADAGSLGMLAEAGDNEAQVLYGAMLYLGLGIPQDLPASRAILGRAAAAGTGGGMLEYAYFLQTYGKEPGDQMAAKALYEKAAATGYGKAQAHLAYRLWNNGVEADRPRALALWDAAAKQGYPYAIFATGVYGGKMDEARAGLEALAAKGDRSGDSWLCELSEYQGQAGTAFDHCLVAAREGFPGAMALTARLYARGEGVTASRKEALYWARLALSQPDFEDPGRKPQTQALAASLETQ